MLTNEDREALASAAGWPGDEHAPLSAAVEAIVARRVAAALNEAADAVRAACPGDHLRQPCSSCCGAARLVRARAARIAAAP